MRIDPDIWVVRTEEPIIVATGGASYTGRKIKEEYINAWTFSMVDGNAYFGDFSGECVAVYAESVFHSAKNLGPSGGIPEEE